MRRRRSSRRWSATARLTSARSRRWCASCSGWTICHAPTTPPTPWRWPSVTSRSRRSGLVLASEPGSKAAVAADRIRLDEALVERGLAESRSRARALIMAGDVQVNGATVTRAGSRVDERDELAVKRPPRFVSRGGEKLEHALAAFGVDVDGKVAADFGASTGGFTDCLLQRGAVRVFAIDVGYGQLAERLRKDPRVVVMDRQNARYLEALPEPVDVISIDVSF